MQNSDSDRERFLLGLLTSVGKEPMQSQRHWASEFGVALGFVNTYLKYCIKKGFVKVKRIPARRYAYYLTPKGLAEKSRLTVIYLSNSLELFRDACEDLVEIYKTAEAQGWHRLVLCGVGEIADIAFLCADGRKAKLVGILDRTFPDEKFRGLPVIHAFEDLAPFDAIIVTDQRNPQAAYDELVMRISPDRILALNILHISQNPRSRVA
jgi:hypothetical protein